MKTEKGSENDAPLKDGWGCFTGGAPELINLLGDNNVGEKIQLGKREGW